MKLGKNDLEKLPNNVRTTEEECKNSVFECIVDQAQSVMLKSLLMDIIDDKVDSLRFYYLGNNYKTKVEHIGVERGIAVDQPLFL